MIESAWRDALQAAARRGEAACQNPHDVQAGDFRFQRKDMDILDPAGKQVRRKLAPWWLRGVIMRKIEIGRKPLHRPRAGGCRPGSKHIPLIAERGKIVPRAADIGQP